MNLNNLEKKLKDFTSGSQEKIDTNILWNRVQPHIHKKKSYRWKMPLLLVALLILISAIGIWILPQSDDDTSNSTSTSTQLTDQLNQSPIEEIKEASSAKNVNKTAPQEKPTTSVLAVNNQSNEIESLQNKVNINQDINSTSTNSPISNQTITNQQITNTPITNTPTTNQTINKLPGIVNTHTNNQITNTPITNKAITNNQVTKNQITNQPFTNNQVTNHQITNQPIKNTQTTNQPITNQPITNKAITNTSITNTQTTNQPVTNNPIANNQVTNNKITNQPITNNPITNQLVTNQPITKIQISSIPLLANQLDAGESTLSQYPKRISPYIRRQFPKLTLELGGSYLAPQKEFILQQDEFASEFASRELAEEVLEGWYATANVRYHLTPNWGISVGIQYGAINERSSTSLTNSETVFLQDTVIGNFVRVDGSVDPIYGDIEIDRTVTKNVSRINSYSFIQLPIELMYKQPLNRLNLEFGIGAIQSIQFSTAGFWHPDTQTEYDLSTDENGYLKSRLGLGLTGRVGVGYDLTPGLGVYAHGRYIKYMSGITSSNYGIEQKYAVLGAEVGIRFHLFN